MKISHKKEKALLLAGYILLLVALWKLDFRCIFQSFFDIPCPGCGMTRALLAALRLDFKQAFSYHPMFWSVPVLGAFLLFDGGLFKRKLWNNLLLCLIAIGFIAVWAIRLVIW